MPAFYSSHSMHSHMPLTPPDSGSGYGYSSMHYGPDPYAHTALSQGRHEGAYDYTQAFIQPQVAPAPAPPSYAYPQSTYSTSNNLPPIHSYYEPMGAPILPPLRIQDGISFTDDYHRRVQQEHDATTRDQLAQVARDEKPVGGVSAKLDYDMDRMADFVAEASQSIFQRNVQSQPSFRKWVHQVLSATRLPSATILLSLHYLNDRSANHPESIATGENQIYRLLAVSLILGSKFLDDNTFINRSWSDVTAIKVGELNMLEMQWLRLIQYQLHVDPKSTNGLQAWLDSWRSYDAKHSARQPQHARLSPLDTNMHRSMIGRERFSPYPSPYTAASGRYSDASHSARSSHYPATPYSSADPWAQSDRQAFDDFYKRQHRYPTLTEIDAVNRRFSEERARQSAYAYPIPAQPQFYQAPSFTSAWDGHAWGCLHRYDCGCASCTYQNHYRPYPLASTHAAQTVMG